MASEVIERAHADLASGQAWRARDGLARHLHHTADEEALVVLGGVLYGMGDLPASGGDLGSGDPLVQGRAVESAEAG